MRYMTAGSKTQLQGPSKPFYPSHTSLSKHLPCPPSIHARLPMPSIQASMPSIQALLCPLSKPLSKPFYALYPSPSMPSIQALLCPPSKHLCPLCHLPKPFYALYPSPSMPSIHSSVVCWYCQSCLRSAQWSAAAQAVCHRW